MRTAGLILFLAVAANHEKRGFARAHYMWAHVTNVGKEDSPPAVEVVFSEAAGVADGVIHQIWDKYHDQGMSQMTHTCCCKSYDFSLELDGDALEGDFFPADGTMKNCSALASGHFDFGPFAEAHVSDLQYSYNAQIYQKCSGWEDFFVPLMGKATFPSIVLHNCGDGNDYQFAVGGFPQGSLDLCLYYQGGLKIGCGTFDVPGGSTAQSLSLKVPDNLKNPMDNRNKAVLIFAKAEMVAHNPDSALLFATTSVYFEGPCKE